MPAFEKGPQANAIGELTPATKEVLQKKPLAGKVYLLTGANRFKQSIGGPTAVALAREGATVILTYRDNERSYDRVSEVISEVEKVGGNAFSHICDVTVPKQRQALFNFVKNEFAQIDGLIQFAAEGIKGTMEEAAAVNTEAPVEMAELFLPITKPGGIMVETPSVVSEFTGLSKKETPGYDKVGPTKHEGRKKMKKLVPKFEKKGVKYTAVCPHLVEDTVNAYLLKRTNRQVFDEARKSAKGGVLPNIANVSDAVVRVAIMAAEGNLKQGHIEWVGVDHLERDELLPLFRGFGFGDEAVYINEITRLGDEGFGSFTPDASSSSAMMMPDMADSFKVVTIDEVEVGRSSVLINESYMRGHLKADPPGLLLPGWKSAGLARRTADAYVAEQFADQGFRFSGFSEGAIFNQMIRPSDELDVRVAIREKTDQEIVFDAVLLKGDENMADVKGLRYSVGPDLPTWPSDSPPPEAFAEIGAMFIGADAMGMGFVEGRVPAFSRFASLELKGIPDPDLPLEVDAFVTKASTRLLQGDAVIRSGDRVVANLTGVSCFLKEV